MTVKPYIVYILLVLLGILIGSGSLAWFGKSFYDENKAYVDSLTSTTDSLLLVDKYRKELNEELIKNYKGNITVIQDNLKDRQDAFENDTTVYSTDELVKRIRTRVYNNR